MKTLTDTDGAQKERKSEEEKEKVAQPNTEYATNVTNTNKKEKKNDAPKDLCGRNHPGFKPSALPSGRKVTETCT